MTIITDIAHAMRETDMAPIGLLLGKSARRAFDADCHWTRVDGPSEKLQLLLRVLPLSRSWTNEFDGWEFILGDRPNPLRRRQRRAA